MWPFKKKKVERDYKVFTIIAKVTKNGIMFSYVNEYLYFHENNYSSSNVGTVVDYLKNRYGEYIKVFGSAVDFPTAEVIYDGTRGQGVGPLGPQGVTGKCQS